MMGLLAFLQAYCRSIPGTAASAAVTAQQAAEAAAAVAETHNYGISVSSHTLVITPPADDDD